MSRNAVGGLASIIAPCWNQLEFTRQCIAALVRHTRRPWELIVVDNGSTDGTAFYLSGVQDAAAVPVIVISNKENRGFPAAINQGLQQARGEYLVLLNNDVVVTDAWLDQLIALAEMRVESGAEGNPPPYPPAQGGRHVNAHASVESNGRGTMIQPGELPSVAGVDSAMENSDSDSASRSLTLNSPSANETDQRRTKDDGPRTSLVGPMSNYATPPQLVENVPYQSLDEMHRFARKWRDEHRGRWFIVPKLSGCCLLMKRAVYEKIGGLDERFGLGFFDDDDFAERARRAGFGLAVGHDLFVHHFGSRTFIGNGIDSEKLLDDNARRFAAKWGKSVPKGRRVALEPWSSCPEFFADSQRAFAPRVDDAKNAALEPNTIGPLPLPKLASRKSNGPPLDVPVVRTLKTSLTVIARNEEEKLPRCLESVAGLFDEIIVVDTGSTDRTAEIARSFGARVFDFPWVDDFAAARNEALARATGDYAFWLDADDVVEPAEREKLRLLLNGLRRGDEAGYVVRCACDPSPDGAGGETVVDHIRLFPLRPDVRWTYRVHEQILPSLRRAKVPVRWTDLIVRHTGYADRELRERKLDRDLRILHLELAERPQDPFLLFNLGAIAVERRKWQDALGYLDAVWPARREVIRSCVSCMP